MNIETPHWGSLQIGGSEGDRAPLRSRITVELSETRALVDQLYREFTGSGRRALAARLIESRREIPWFLVRYQPGRLTSR